MRRRHPVTILRNQRIDRQKYEAIKVDTIARWKELTPTFDDPLATLIDAHARAVVRAARFRDKFEIVRQMVQSAHGVEGMSDEDVLIVLAGWTPCNVRKVEYESIGEGATE